MLPTPDPKTIILWIDGKKFHRVSCACGFQDKSFTPKAAASQHNNRVHHGTFKVKDMRNG